MGKYVDNIYNKYLQQNWCQKFLNPGIYSISINNKIVYVGKSMNMLYRMAEHWASMTYPKENKYRVLSEAKCRNYNVKFDVLYYAKSRRYADKLAEIGEKEGEYIRKYNPILNTQIPKAENWERWETKSVDAKSILESIL